MKDIMTRGDIELMVNTFYSAVRKDELLAPTFNHVIGTHWNKHLDTMYEFWQTVLLHEFAYKGSPFTPHRKLPLSQNDFDRWLTIFKTSVDINFKGKVAEEAKWRAEKMAQMFMHKLNINSY